MRSTLKTTILLFEGTFVSDSSGGIRSYLATDETRRLFGQASSARVSVVGTSMTSTARVQVRFFDTATPKVRPTELEQGYAHFDTTGTITTLTPAPHDVTGPFCDNVDIVLEVDDTAAASKQDWTGAVYATLFYT